MIGTEKKNIKLGSGIYSIPELSFILCLPKHKVRRWMNDFWDSHLGASYQSKYSWGQGRDRVTNFLTLIEFYVFYQLRENKVTTKKILEAHKLMEKVLNTHYPFASSEVLTEGKNIFFSLEDGTTIYADKSRQIVIKNAIESFCKKIEFAKDHLADKYWPLGKGSHIVVDPRHQFGQPIVVGTNITAAAIYAMYQSGEKINVIGILYDLTQKQVADAITFCKRKVA